MHGKMVRSARSSFLPSPKPPAPQSQSKKRRRERKKKASSFPAPPPPHKTSSHPPYIFAPLKSSKVPCSRSRFHHPSFPSLINSTMQRKERFAPIHPPSLKNSAPCLVCICAQFALQNSACISQKDLEAFRDRGVTHPHPQKRGTDPLEKVRSACTRPDMGSLGQGEFLNPTFICRMNLAKGEKGTRKNNDKRL